MSTEIFTHKVNVDYSQFYLLGRIASTDASKVVSRDYGLVALDPLNYALFSAFTQHGELPIIVSIHEKAPKVRKTPQDVVEFSVAVREPLALCGWGEEAEDGFQLPLEEAATYRVRYSVSGADSPEEAGEYRLDFWKAPFDDFKIVKESKAGGKLNLQAAAKHARTVVNVLPKGERTESIVRIALKERPAAAAAVAEGDNGAALDVILAYTNKIRPREFDYPTVPELIRELAEFQRDGVLDSRSSSYVSELKTEDRGWFSKLTARLGGDKRS